MLKFILPFITWAYIPPTTTILEKTAENAGTGTYVIEQEVRLVRANEQVLFKEIWSVESDKTMRLQVIPEASQRNAFRYQAIYSGGNRWTLNFDKKRQSQKLPEEFAEKWFFFKGKESLAQALLNHKILSSLPSPQSPKKTKTGLDYKVEPEKGVRLSRAQGVVSYGFGDLDQATSPALWIEQDQFVLRKLKWSTQATMVTDNIKSYVKNLRLPENQVIQWDQSRAEIHVLNVTLKPAAAIKKDFQLTSLDQIQSFEGFKSEESQRLTEEFFARFR